MIYSAEFLCCTIDNVVGVITIPDDNGVAHRYGVIPTVGYINSCAGSGSFSLVDENGKTYDDIYNGYHMGFLNIGNNQIQGEWREDCNDNIFVVTVLVH